MIGRPGAPGGVLWDLDGTLVDSAGHHWIAWRDTLAAEGRPVQPGDFANTFGKRNDEILRELFGPGIAVDWIERVAEAKEQTYRRLLRERGLEALPGAFDWLGRLRASGWKQALASSAPRPTSTPCSRRSPSSASWTRSSRPTRWAGASPTRPLPGSGAAAGPRPRQCIVVEDAPAGLEAARRAGMRSIGVLSDHHPTLEADVVVPSLDALPEAVFEALVAGR